MQAKETIREQRTKVGNLERQIVDFKKALEDLKDEGRRKSDEVRRRNSVH